MSLTLFDSSQSVWLDCSYHYDKLGLSGEIYYCHVQNSVTISSPYEATVRGISEYHESNMSNDNVEGLIVSDGQMDFFPQDVDKFFKNLKIINFSRIGLKEVHKNDLKDFPKLTEIYLYSNQLKVLDENLFEFNPNLELIDLTSNKITQIDPNVFDKLTKLKNLQLNSNTCINMEAENPSEVQNVINAVKTQCNSEYPKLDQKVKDLEVESKYLNSEKFNEKIENLEHEIKSSKFANFFQEKVHNLRAVQAKEARIEKLFAICSALESKIDNMEKKIEEQNRNLEDKLTKLIKALKIDE